jgi:hypothetical protein
VYKILSKILFSRLIPYGMEIIGDHQCGFEHNRSNTDQIFCISQILRKNGNASVVLDLRKAYDSLRREALYNILIEIGIPLNW